MNNPYEPPQVICRDPVPIMDWIAAIAEHCAIAVIVVFVIAGAPLSLAAYFVSDIWPDFVFDILQGVFPMSRIHVTDGKATFFCPGCKAPHTVNVAGHSTGHASAVSKAKRSPNWVWNGSETRPTLTPSIKLTGNIPATEDSERVDFCCHSFVEQGVIRFLSDCTHELRGQAVPLLAIPDEHKHPYKEGDGLPVASKW